MTVATPTPSRPVSDYEAAHHARMKELFPEPGSIWANLEVYELAHAKSGARLVEDEYLNIYPEPAYSEVLAYVEQMEEGPSEWSFLRAAVAAETEAYACGSTPKWDAAVEERLQEQRDVYAAWDGVQPEPEFARRAHNVARRIRGVVQTVGIYRTNVVPPERESDHVQRANWWSQLEELRTIPLGNITRDTHPDVLSRTYDANWPNDQESDADRSRRYEILWLINRERDAGTEQTYIDRRELLRLRESDSETFGEFMAELEVQDPPRAALVTSILNAEQVTA